MYDSKVFVGRIALMKKSGRLEHVINIETSCSYICIYPYTNLKSLDVMCFGNIETLARIVLARYGPDFRDHITYEATQNKDGVSIIGIGHNFVTFIGFSEEEIKDFDTAIEAETVLNVRIPPFY